jgi:hypothetical protein
MRILIRTKNLPFQKTDFQLYAYTKIFRFFLLRSKEAVVSCDQLRHECCDLLRVKKAAVRCDQFTDCFTESKKDIVSCDEFRQECCVFC